ncbi:hypothetical protein [Niallia taxi]|uniref:hypothetical protein n=1 Tax=Niallia taxi TaxID=2499688 RepID=UPI0030089A39
MKTVIGKMEISYVHLIKELGVSLEKAKEIFNADNIAAVSVVVTGTDGTVIKVSGSYLDNSMVEDVEDDEEGE